LKDTVMSDLTTIVHPKETGPLASKVQGGWALAKAQAARVTKRISHDRVFGHLSDDVWYSVNTTAYRRFSVLRQLLPSLPAENVQIDYIGKAGDAALREAFRFYQTLCALAARANRRITA
jgi:hypothetical protein